jgi:hypothetical protein
MFRGRVSGRFIVGGLGCVSTVDGLNIDDERRTRTIRLGAWVNFRRIRAGRSWRHQRVEGCTIGCGEATKEGWSTVWGNRRCGGVLTKRRHGLLLF